MSPFYPILYQILPSVRAKSHVPCAEARGGPLLHTKMDRCRTAFFCMAVGNRVWPEDIVSPRHKAAAAMMQPSQNVPEEVKSNEKCAKSTLMP
jgi:hypothetical protein